MGEAVEFGGLDYWITFGLLVLGRGMDLLSTWLASPNLALEGNPIAKKMGWRGGILFNSLICVVLAMWPMLGMTVTTTSLLVAARNFKFCWWMRSLGESRYMVWTAEVMSKGSLRVYLASVVGETMPYVLIGSAVVYYGADSDPLLCIGRGAALYGLVVAFFLSLNFWKLSRSGG